MVFGFIGDECQRLRMKFLSVERDRSHPDRYTVLGKSHVRTTTCSLHGELAIEHVRRDTDPLYGTAEFHRDSASLGSYALTGSYRLVEDNACAHAGAFEGKFISWFYLDKYGLVHYADANDVADSYLNNAFVGEWRSGIGKVKRCNWGDWRIPNSGDFDIGAGEFSPDDKYLPFGWKSYRDAFFGPGPNEKAMALESAEWWK